MALTKARLLKHDFPVHGYRAKTSLTNFPECFPHLFLSHFEPKTSHNARFWGPTALVFWGHRAPTIWANKKEVSNGPQKVTDPIFVNPPPEGLLKNAKVLRCTGVSHLLYRDTFRKYRGQGSIGFSWLISAHTTVNTMNFSGMVHAVSKR